MPNVTLEESIEASHVALVNSHDERLRSIAHRNRGLEKFLGAFRDEFGNQILPTIGIVRDDACQIVQTVAAFGGFRDAVCVSAIVAGRSLALVSKSNPIGIVHSDAFDVYPWFPTLQFDGRVSTVTPELAAQHDVWKLRPQSAPALARRSLAKSTVDLPLLQSIREHWEHCFAVGKELDRDRRLFRALEMARAASKMPGGIDASEHDAGRAVAQWVSAFEILAHDGKHADFRSVLSLLGSAQWLRAALKDQDREVTYKRESIRTNLAGAICERLYKARNHFIHRNPVTKETLTLEKCQKHVHWFAASLFRLALTAFLDLRFSETLSDTASDEDRGRHLASRMSFLAAQRLAEDAILIADEAPARS
jgi:hypothetical protein